MKPESFPCILEASVSHYPYHTRMNIADQLWSHKLHILILLQPTLPRRYTLSEVLQHLVLPKPILQLSHQLLQWHPGWQMSLSVLHIYQFLVTTRQVSLATSSSLLCRIFQLPNPSWLARACPVSSFNRRCHLFNIVELRQSDHHRVVNWRCQVSLKIGVKNAVIYSGSNERGWGAISGPANACCFCSLCQLHGHVLGCFPLRKIYG